MSNIDISLKTANGIVLQTEGTYCEENIRITPALQEKIVTPASEMQTITPDANNVGLSKVTIEAIDNEEKTVTITESGTTEITPTTGKSGLSKVTAIVNVPATTPRLQEKTVTPTKSSQSITPDSNYDGLSKITVNAIPDEYIITADATATANKMLSGATAYVKGSKITGTILTYNGNYLPMLAVPQNESITNNTLSFDSVEGATSYNIYANSTLLGTVSST